MSASHQPPVTWTNVPTQSITAGGVSFAYRELGVDNPGPPVVSSSTSRLFWTTGIPASSTASRRSIA